MDAFEDNNHNTDNQNQTQDNTANQELNKCKLELQAIKDSYLRLNADFDNFKKRTEKEKGSWIQSCQASMLVDILPIIDDFDRAFSNYKEGENKDLDAWIKGLELIYKSLLKFLDKYQVAEMKDVTTFNPEYHEAIVQVESDKHKSGDIVTVLQKGYMLRDEVLRPAQVTVAK